MSDDLRAKLRSEIQAVDAAALLPHQRRDALLVLEPSVDLLDIAVAIAKDDVAAITGLIADGRLSKPDLGELADWCVDVELRFQFVIVQPYVLAQKLPKKAAQARN
ncbi:MAG: DUF2288 family protein [Deltaproteobacteria bacterium]|nr:DUF2288 family protein [Deltaproteobacteria bacterium]